MTPEVGSTDELFSVFKTRAEDEFLSLLRFISGDKELIISVELFRRVDRITSADSLRKTGVKTILKLEQEIGSPKYVRVFFIRCSISALQQMISILGCNPIFETVHIICVPRVIFNVKHMLEREGLLDNVVLHSLPSWEVIFLDNDLLSMEINSFYASLYLANETLWLSTVASALLNIQMHLGQTRAVYAIGPVSQKVYRLMNLLKEEQMLSGGSSRSGLPPDADSQIEHMVIVDRSLDYATLFCSQMCYEGLVDECFDVNAGIASVPNAVLKVNPVDKDSLIVFSGNSDRVFNTLRSVHVTSLFSRIKALAESLRKEMDTKKEEVSSKDVGSIKAMVKTEVRDLFERERLLQRHLALAEFIMHAKKQLNFKEQLQVERNILCRKDYEGSLLFIQYRICRSLNWARTLQLMCLMSVCQDGIPFSDFENLRKMFLSSYGYHYLPLLLSLEKLGILKYKSISGNFGALVRKLNLLPMSEPLPQQPSTSVNASSSSLAAERLATTKALSSVFDSFYVPMLCRLIESQLFDSAVLSDVSSELGSDCFQSSDAPRSFRHHVLAKGLANSPSSDRSVLVVFIGGCTHSEINALRTLGNAKGYRIYTLTTNVWTYERFLDQIALNSL